MALTFEMPGQLELYADTLAKLGSTSDCTEAVAIQALDYLYKQLNEGADNPCALVRFFRTVSFSELTPELQTIACKNLPGDQNNLINCLTLLASRGMEADWNDRRASTKHQVIPLLSPQMIEAAPMVAQLIKRLGIDVAKVVNPEPNLFLNPLEKDYSVLYVEDASGDQTIVAQRQFVEPYNIRSVIGLGGLLPTGDMFAIMIFMRVLIAEKMALRFGILARAIETAISNVRSGKKKSARILMAATADGADRLQKLLGSDHSLVQVNTIEQAIQAGLSETFDLILCATQFDDSRMFDLLQAVKQNKLQKPKPFICLKLERSNLKNGTHHGASTAARMIGAKCYMEAIDMNDDEILRGLQAYLPEDIWLKAGSRSMSFAEDRK